jgi:hypothetical protein
MLKILGQSGKVMAAAAQRSCIDSTRMCFIHSSPLSPAGPAHI